jgi:hypothetical protein
MPDESYSRKMVKPFKKQAKVLQEGGKLTLISEVPQNIFSINLHVGSKVFVSKNSRYDDTVSYQIQFGQCNSPICTESSKTQTKIAVGSFILVAEGKSMVNMIGCNSMERRETSVERDEVELRKRRN